jgi:hypothetical protein
LSVSGVVPVVLLAGSETVLLLSVQLSVVTLTVTPSLAVAPLEVVPLSTTVTVIAVGAATVADTVHLKEVSVAPMQWPTTVSAWATSMVALTAPAASRPLTAI